MKKLTPHPQAEILCAIAQGKQIQVRHIGYSPVVWDTVPNPLVFIGDGARELRIKPEVILINNIEVPEPVRERLNYGTPYFMVSVGDASYTEHTWRDHIHDFRWLKHGQIQLTREGAIAQAKAIIAACGGETRSDIVGYRVISALKGEIPEGFTPWKGGECPVPSETQVEVVFDDGLRGFCAAAYLRWASTNPPTSGNIIAYKVVT